MGVVMLGSLSFVQSSSGGLALIGYLLLGVAILVFGGAILLALFRRTVKSKDPEAERLDNVKDQIVWRAMSQSNQTTAADVAGQTGMTENDAEQALIALVSEGRAVAAADESGSIVYRIGAPSDAPGGT